MGYQWKELITTDKLKTINGESIVGSGNIISKDISVNEVKQLFTLGVNENEISSNYEFVKKANKGTGRPRGLVYGNGYIVSVGNSGQVEYSSNGGDTWNIVNKFATGTLTSVAYGNGRFVAVEYENNKIWSTDLPMHTWENVYTFEGGSLEGCRYVNNEFVVVGTNGCISRSTDGKNWRTVHKSTSTGTFYDVAYGNGRYIVCGESGFTMTSVNGEDWYDNQINNLDKTMRAITYANGTFVVGAQNGELRWSEDGLNWNVATNPSPYGVSWIRGFAYGDNRLYAASYGNSSGEIWMSRDKGRTWEHTLDVTDGTRQFWCIAYGDDSFIAGRGDGSLYMLDLDVAWTSEKPTEASYSKFVIVQNDGSKTESDVYYNGSISNGNSSLESRLYNVESLKGSEWLRIAEVSTDGENASGIFNVDLYATQKVVEAVELDRTQSHELKSGDRIELKTTLNFANYSNMMQSSVPLNLYNTSSTILSIEREDDQKCTIEINGERQTGKPYKDFMFLGYNPDGTPLTIRLSGESFTEDFIEMLSKNNGSSPIKINILEKMFSNELYSSTTFARLTKLAGNIKFNLPSGNYNIGVKVPGKDESETYGPEAGSESLSFTIPFECDRKTSTTLEISRNFNIDTFEDIENPEDFYIEIELDPTKMEFEIAVPYTFKEDESLALSGSLLNEYGGSLYRLYKDQISYREGILTASVFSVTTNYRNGILNADVLPITQSPEFGDGGDSSGSGGSGDTSSDGGSSDNVWGDTSAPAKSATAYYGLAAIKIEQYDKKLYICGLINYPATDMYNNLRVNLSIDNNINIGMLDELKVIDLTDIDEEEYQLLDGCALEVNTPYEFRLKGSLKNYWDVMDSGAVVGLHLYNKVEEGIVRDPVKVFEISNDKSLQINNSNVGTLGGPSFEGLIRKSISFTLNAGMMESGASVARSYFEDLQSENMNDYILRRDHFTTRIKKAAIKLNLSAASMNEDDRNINVVVRVNGEDFYNLTEETNVDVEIPNLVEGQDRIEIFNLGNSGAYIHAEAYLLHEGTDVEFSVKYTNEDPEILESYEILNNDVLDFRLKLVELKPHNMTHSFRLRSIYNELEKIDKTSDELKDYINDLSRRVTTLDYSETYWDFESNNFYDLIEDILKEERSIRIYKREGYPTESVIALSSDKYANGKLIREISIFTLTKNKNSSGFYLNAEIPYKEESLEFEELTEDMWQLTGVGGGGVDSEDVIEIIDEIATEVEPIDIGTSETFDPENDDQVPTSKAVANYISLNGGGSSFSGDYNDLTNKPNIPTKLSELTADISLGVDSEEVLGIIEENSVEVEELDVEEVGTIDIGNSETFDATSDEQIPTTKAVQIMIENYLSTNYENGDEGSY